MTEWEHEQYHLEVSLTGCGYPNCDRGNGLALHFKVLNELENEQSRLSEDPPIGDDVDCFDEI